MLGIQARLAQCRKLRCACSAIGRDDPATCGGGRPASAPAPLAKVGIYIVPTFRLDLHAIRMREEPLLWGCTRRRRRVGPFLFVVAGRKIGGGWCAAWPVGLEHTPVPGPGRIFLGREGTQRLLLAVLEIRAPPNPFAFVPRHSPAHETAQREPSRGVSCGCCAALIDASPKLHDLTAQRCGAQPQQTPT